MRLSRNTVLNTISTHVYVYGDDKTRLSFKGQGATFGGLPNCWPITTKWRCCDMPSSFFDDKQFELMIRPTIDGDIEQILVNLKGRQLVIVPKIGQGCSQLKARAPISYEYIQNHIRLLKSHEC